MRRASAEFGVRAASTHPPRPPPVSTSRSEGCWWGFWSRELLLAKPMHQAQAMALGCSFARAAHLPSRCAKKARAFVRLAYVSRANSTKTRVRDKTPQNAPRTRPDVEKEDQKAELKKNQTRRRYVEKTSIFFQTAGRHPPGARRETTEVKTRKC